MISKLEKIFSFFMKSIAMLFTVAVIIFIVYVLTVMFWPFMYKRTIYDLGDKYLSWERAAHSDTSQMVIVSKDGKHRVVTKWVLTWRCLRRQVRRICIYSVLPAVR